MARGVPGSSKLCVGDSAAASEVVRCKAPSKMMPSNTPWILACSSPEALTFQACVTNCAVPYINVIANSRAILHYDCDQLQHTRRTRMLPPMPQPSPPPLPLPHTPHRPPPQTPPLFLRKCCAQK